MKVPAKQAPALLFENAAGQVLADSAGFLRLVWSANARQLTDTQSLMRAVSQHLRQRGWSRLLGDQTNLVPFSPEEQHWIGQEWLPGEARTSGYRHGAILVSSHVLSRLATAAITSAQPASGLRYRSFDDEATAVSWLLRQPA
ncbi:hypothetical protein HHL22_15220 [Hymenobacter sp. RP-2-7]|uniref:STAS/SEC14 domain-containing protein n=1 Tax=Hymenobacter polaris TaxID=2682546 RepID=A0A7Y0AFS4_9BACT|nr:hypothetical protein [Hymenobacter polaris]NML66558.1 hypothetical protein [Hymenobacter polaris]